MTRLAAVLTAVGLATSRIGLVVHELAGHGGAVLAVGGTVTDVQLFTFAGGWIRFRVAAPGNELVIALAGIALEAAIGLGLWVAARRDALAARIVRGVGAALLIHAGWYLATGTWHGYGDGLHLHRQLGDDRWLVAVPAALIVCVVAYAGARAVLGPLAATVPGGRGARISGTALAVVLAGGLQLGLAVGEVKLRRDTTYASTMRPERERQIARELAQWTAERARHGAQPSPQARAQMERDLGKRHRTFPFAIVLAVLTAISIAVGAVRSRSTPDDAVPGRILAVSAAIAVGSIALVIALDAAFL